MKFFKLIVLGIVFSSLVSCGFFGKSDKDKPSLLDIGKKLVKEVKKQQDKNKKDMDVEFTKEGKEAAKKYDPKTVSLNEEHFDVAVKNLDSAIDDVKILSEEIKDKTKDGKLSAMDTFSIIGKISGFATGYSTEYIEKNFEGSKKNEMKAAFSKIMGMYMVESTILKGKKSKNSMSQEKLNQMKKQIESMSGSSEEKAKAKKSFEEMEKQLKSYQEYRENPLKDYPENEVEEFKQYKPKLDEKIVLLKKIIKEMGENLKSKK